MTEVRQPERLAPFAELGTLPPRPDTESGSAFMFEPLLTDVQAAKLLGIHPKTLQRLARNGQVPAHRIGRFWRFRASELDKWLTCELHSPCQSVRVNSKEIQ